MASRAMLEAGVDSSNRQSTRSTGQVAEMVTAGSKRSQIISPGPDQKTTSTKRMQFVVIATVEAHQVSSKRAGRRAKDS